MKYTKVTFFFLKIDLYIQQHSIDPFMQFDYKGYSKDNNYLLIDEPKSLQKVTQFRNIGFFYELASNYFSMIFAFSLLI